jgi:hypothetical protein
MWTKITRPKYEREGQRYASNVTDTEWALIEPHMPAAKPLGRPREIELRAVLDAILYIARTGCQWRCCRRTFLRSSPLCPLCQKALAESAVEGKDQPNGRECRVVMRSGFHALPPTNAPTSIRCAFPYRKIAGHL